MSRATVLPCFLTLLAEDRSDFLTCVRTTPFADFSRPVRMDRSILSHDFVTSERSPEVSSAASAHKRRIYIQCS
jgi:hypothetical protein